MLSVIVPVYNCENHLDRCINSILNQTYRDIELILVDDGSGDKSGDICKRYAKEDNRVIYVYKENGGASSARNTGLDKAKGEFIQFADADDYLENNMCMELLDPANESDIVICGYNLIAGDNIKQMLPGNSKGNIKDIDRLIPGLFSNWFINSPWNKLYKRSLIKNGFNTDCSLGEDLLFNLEYLKGVNTFTAINKALYNYISDNEGSLTKRRGQEYIQSIKDVYRSSAEFYKNFCSCESTMKDITAIYIDSFIEFIKSNMKNKELIKKIVTDPFTHKVFESYNPPSKMQERLKGFVLNNKLNSVCNYVRLRGWIKKAF